MASPIVDGSTVGRIREEVLALTGDIEVPREVRLEDIEGAGAKFLRFLEDFRIYWLRQLRKPGVKGTLGVIVLFFGGHFKHLAVVFHSLGGVELEQLRVQVNAVSAEYRRAREVLEHSGSGDFVVVPPGPQLVRAAVAVDHRSLLTSLQTLQSSVVAQVAASLNGNTARILLGLEFGRRAAEVIGDRLETMLLGPPEEDQAHGADDLRVWQRIAIDTACTGAGVAVAWALRGWAALWTTCGFGAKLCMEALDDGMDLSLMRQPNLWGTIITTIGFLHQLRHWGKPPLPAPLWILMLPIRGLEHGLQKLA